MRLLIAAVGKPRDSALASAISEYEKRAARYWPLEVHEVKEERSGSLAPGEIRKREATRLADKLHGTRVVACDERGRTFDSRNFAEWLRAQRESAADVAFAIGGAFGLHRDLTDRATMLLSLSPWTLPHELARLVLAEQLYRAGSILRREPYHK